MIEVRDLCQKYGKKIVLDHVNVTIEQHECCALVGRNGVGKSTFIHSILGLIPIKKGSVFIKGKAQSTSEWKKYVAYLPEKFHLYPHLSAEENLHFFASLNKSKLNEEKIEEVLTLVNLYNNRKEMIKGFSKGMLQRLGLAIMLYYDSEILILDEPTSGLDPIGRKEILAILKGLKNKTILLSSHHMDEIKQICTHIAFLDHGRIDKYRIDDFREVGWG